jgi:hypothetical protein
MNRDALQPDLAIGGQCGQSIDEILWFLWNF